jgi:hypothetical protein
MVTNQLTTGGNVTVAVANQMLFMPTKKATAPTQAAKSTLQTLSRFHTQMQLMEVVS